MATAALSAEQRIQQVQATAKSQVGDEHDLARDEQIASASKWGSMGAGLAVASKGGWVGVAAYGAAIGGGYAGAWLADAVGADELAAQGMEKFLGMQRIGGGGPHPARITDEVAHSHAFGGFLASIIVGAIAAVAVGALIVATGGVAAVAIIGAAAAGGLTAGFLGSAIGKAAAGMGTRTGPIAEGSPDVFIEGLAAARMTDKVACSKESTPQPIIEGSETIFVNGLPLARIGHKVLCNAVIDQGATTVDMDETTVACAQPAPDIPLWARVAADWLGFLPVGKVAAMMGSRSRSAAASGRSQCNVTCAKDPVDVATGRFVDWRCDLSIPGPLPIEWRRHYATGRNTAPGFHGSAWLDSWSVCLNRKTSGGETTDYHDDEGVVFTFHTPDEVLEAEHLRNPALVLRGTHDAPELWDRDSGIRSHFEWHGDGDHARLAAYSDASGNRCEFLYATSASGSQLSELRHSDGWRLQLVWRPEALDEPATIQSVWLDDPGRPMVELVRFEHDDQGRLTASASVQSGRLRYTYDARHRIVAWGDDASTRVRLSYDDLGRVSEVVTPDHLHSGRFKYDAERRITQVWSLDGVNSEPTCDEYHYNDDGLVTLERNPLGNETRTEWDRHHRVLSTTDALGRTTRNEYDDAGRLVQVVDPQDRSRTYAYDAEGRLLLATDTRGRTLGISYDAIGRIETQTQANQTTRYEYLSHGLLLREHQPDGGVTQYHYDESHRPRGTSAPNGAHTAWRQDRLGRLDWLTDALGATTTYDYEPGGHPTQPSAVAPRANVHAQPSRIVLPDGAAISQAFTSEGLLAERTDAAGHTERWRWGAFDLLSEHVDAAGRSTQYRYGAAGGGSNATPRLNELINAAGQSWRWHYDAAGQLVEQTDTAGRSTRWEHDGVGRPLRRMQPDGSTWRYTWDNADKLLSIDAGDVRHSYGYDEFDRLIQASVWRREPGKPEHCDSDLGLEYDDQDRLVAEVHRLDGEAEPRRIRYEYDALGRRSLREGPLGECHYAYDALGLLRELHSPHGSIQLNRNALGQETERTGVAPTAAAQAQPHPQFRLHQRYNKLGQLVSQQSHGPAAHRTDTVQRHYHWQHQRLVGLDDARFGHTRWTLDARDQVLQTKLDPAQQQHPTTSMPLGRHPHEVVSPVTQERFSYDAMGQLAAAGEEPLHYQRDVVTARGPDRYEWDTRGRLIRRTLIRPGFRPRTWRYTWDGLNRLTQLHTPQGEHWRYVYDAFGRRRAKLCVSQAPAPGAGVPRPRLRRAEYLWDGAAVAAQWKVYADGSSAAPGMSASPSRQAEVQEWHYEADGSFRPLAVVQQRFENEEATLYHVVSDLNGSPRELIGHDGELVWAGQLDTWGRLRRCDVRDRDQAHVAQFSLGYRAAANDAQIDVDLRFANQWADEESGLHYNLHRYYDPDLAGYLSQDPLGPEGGIRTHGYVHNPLTWVDPLGLAGCPGGNEVFYRSMPDAHYEHLLKTGKLLPTTETSISPSQAYAAKYDGQLVKFTVKPGTTKKLADIGIAANKPASQQYPNMSTQKGPWMQTNTRFKGEGGQITTQLGQGKGISVFNKNIVKFEHVPR